MTSIDSFKETVPGFVVIPPISVGSSATQLMATLNVALGVLKGILIKAPGSTDDVPNDKSVFIGRSNVTTSTGFPLAPGESVVLPIEAASSVYAVASDTSQKLCIIVV